MAGAWISNGEKTNCWLDSQVSWTKSNDTIYNICVWIWLFHGRKYLKSYFFTQYSSEYWWKEYSHKIFTDIFSLASLLPHWSFPWREEWSLKADEAVYIHMNLMACLSKSPSHSMLSTISKAETKQEISSFFCKQLNTTQYSYFPA